MERVFKSKVDWWYYVLLVCGLAMAFVTAGVLLLSVSIVSILTTLIVILPMAGLPLWLLVATRYTLSEHRLNIQSGPFKWVILIPDIVSIKETTSPISSPALSLDRLEIKTRDHRTILISPEDKESFLDAIQLPPNE